MNESYMKFWGKAGQAQSAGESEARWHPAACHMLDVAAVALEFLEQAEPSIPGIEKDTCRYWPSIAFIIALHDIGKFSRPFQQKRRDLWPESLGAYQQVAETPRHDTAGFWMLRNSFENILEGMLPELVERERAAVMRAICGHHGRPPEELPGNTSDAVCKTCIENAEDRAPWRGVGLVTSSRSPARLAGFIRLPRRAA
jgi:CRISPR-associated endonuclease/helicase Cas3